MCAACDGKGFLTVAIAPHQVYGPRDMLFLHNFLAAHRRLRVMGDGRNKVSLCHVDNYCHGAWSGRGGGGGGGGVRVPRAPEAGAAQSSAEQRSAGRDRPRTPLRLCASAPAVSRPFFPKRLLLLHLCRAQGSSSARGRCTRGAPRWVRATPGCHSAGTHFVWPHPALGLRNLSQKKQSHCVNHPLCVSASAAAVASVHTLTRDAPRFPPLSLRREVLHCHGWGAAILLVRTQRSGCPALRASRDPHAAP